MHAQQCPYCHTMLAMRGVQRDRWEISVDQDFYPLGALDSVTGEFRTIAEWNAAQRQSAFADALKMTEVGA